MVLNKILKPILTPFSKEKWQSRNLEVRKKAVQELPVSDQETLNYVAMNDTDESIRALAANKLSDLDLLQTIIMKGTNEVVKQAAQTRLFQLLCGLKHPIPDFDVREKMIRGSRNPALLEFVAANAEQEELRELTIKRISRDPLLGDIALTDNSPRIRQLAAQQIAKRSTLERVAKHSRRKDKRVYKIVKSKLDRIIEDEERPLLLSKEVHEICDKLDKLYKRNRLLQEKSTFENYVTRWSEIQNFADEATTEHYHAICAKIINGIDELEQQHHQELQTIENLEQLLTTLSTAVDELLMAREAEQGDHKTIDDKEKLILSLGEQWDSVIKSLNDKDRIHTFNARFQAVLDLAESESSPVAKNHSLEKLQSLVQQAEAMLNHRGYMFEKTISALEYKFNQQVEGISSTDVDNLAQRFHAAMGNLKQQLTTQQQQAQQFIKQIDARTEKIQAMIADGLVSKADKLLHELFKQIDNSDLLSSSEKQHFHSDLKDLQSQLGDLSAWRNWAHDKERENLISKAEKLVQLVQDNNNLAAEFQDITSEIKALRNQWKKMRSHTQEEQWQRFNTACNQAYEPCIEFIDQQSELRKANLKAKQQLCEQIENYIAKMGWPSDDKAPVDNSIDWIQVDKITRQARKEWSNIGFVERKAHKSINHRFDKGIEIIRQELKRVWHINQQQFNDLIKQVQNLTDLLDEDLDTAIFKAKECQQQWKTIGPVSSYQRNKLWKKFRKACDVIFDKRQDNIDQRNSQNNERVREKEAICENLEALNQQPLSRLHLENAFNDIEGLWQELAPQARSLSKDVNQRYTKAKNVFRDKLNALKLLEQEQQLALLRQKAQLCTRIESMTDNSETQIQQLNAQWQELETLPSALETRIKKRFEAAMHTLHSQESAKETLKASELQHKREFCLKYEVLLGHESPKELQQARMEMQVELLNDNLGHNRAETDEHKIQALELHMQWYEITNYTQDAGLEQRFNQLTAG